MLCFILKFITVSSNNLNLFIDGIKQLSMTLWRLLKQPGRCLMLKPYFCLNLELKVMQQEETSRYCYFCIYFSLYLVYFRKILLEDKVQNVLQCLGMTTAATTTMTYTWKGHTCHWYHYYVGCTCFHRSKNISKLT